MATYTYEDTLHQIIKVLLRQHIEDNPDHWVDVNSFQEITYRISADELRAASDLVMSVQIHDHVDIATRHVTIRAVRVDRPTTSTRGLPDPRE